MRIRKALLFSLIIWGILLYNQTAWPVVLQQDGELIIPDKAGGKITIDGSLDEAVWQLPPIKKVFKTMNPNYGDPLTQATWVWTAYDRENLYFAFKSFDTEPDKIKTSIAQRDNIARDDFVGILLDALGNKQTSYEFYINPNGIQWDAITSAVSGADQAPDFVWESAGKVTSEGYQVEVRLPLESIRYQDGKEVKMGIIFVRQISRLGTVGTWPELEPGQTDFNFMADILYRDLKGALKLELLPNFTYSLDSEKVSADTRDKTTDTNIGMGVKYGITSSMTVEATVNPDFSQVESDVFQVEVNRRYPVFFSEKRPFFMESTEVLDFGIIDGGMMPVPIHTRQIIDPGWAAKFSGSAGRMNFALLAANDRAPGRETGSDENAFFGIVRAKYNIGSDNSIGILYSGRRFAGGKNDVAGIDLKYRIFKDLRASLSYLYTSTGEAEGTPLKKGDGLNAMLQYSKSNFTCVAAYERYGSDFFMATAFYNRVGFGRGYIQAGPRFNIKLDKVKWLKRIAPFINYTRLHDLGTGMEDISRVLGLNLGFAPKGEVTVEYRDEDEAWAAILHDKKYFNSYGNIQLLKWLHVTANFLIGDQIYYHPTDSFVGSGTIMDLGFWIEPGINLKVGLNYIYSGLKEKQDNRQVYSLNIYNIHTTYQFNKYFFLRGIVRYDDYQDKVLTDLLASFTLIPGTVVHLGYGTLHQRNRWEYNHWVPGQGDFLNMKQGLFFKASYLWRIK